MFGAFIRAAAGYAGAMLIASVLKEVLDPIILPRLASALGKDHLLYNGLNGVQIWLPFVVFFTILLTMVHRGAVENQMAGV